MARFQAVKPFLDRRAQHETTVAPDVHGLTRGLDQKPILDDAVRRVIAAEQSLVDDATRERLAGNDQLRRRKLEPKSCALGRRQLQRLVEAVPDPPRAGLDLLLGAVEHAQQGLVHAAPRQQRLEPRGACARRVRNVERKGERPELVLDATREPIALESIDRLDQLGGRVAVGRIAGAD
jgi:hypothetical protein